MKSECCGANAYNTVKDDVGICSKCKSWTQFGDYDGVSYKTQKSYYYPLFHKIEELTGVTLIDSDLMEICDVVTKLEKTHKLKTLGR